MKVENIIKTTNVLVIIMIACAIFCFWSVSQQIEDAGGIKQVVIFGECYVEDYGKIKRILSPEDIFNISIKGEYHE